MSAFDLKLLKPKPFTSNNGRFSVVVVFFYGEILTFVEMFLSVFDYDFLLQNFWRWQLLNNIQLKIILHVVTTYDTMKNDNN